MIVNLHLNIQTLSVFFVYFRTPSTLFQLIDSERYTKQLQICTLNEKLRTSSPFFLSLSNNNLVAILCEKFKIAKIKIKSIPFASIFNSVWEIGVRLFVDSCRIEVNFCKKLFYFGPIPLFEMLKHLFLTLKWSF